MSKRVRITPMPNWMRKLPSRYWTVTPPTFPHGEPTEEDLRLARELYEALDPLSKRWHWSLAEVLGLPPPPDADGEVQPTVGE